MSPRMRVVVSSSSKANWKKMVNKKLGKLAQISGDDSKDDKAALQINPTWYLSAMRSWSEPSFTRMEALSTLASIESTISP